MDWPFSHSPGGIAGQASVSHLSFCSLPVISIPGQLSSWLPCWDKQRGDELIWSFCVCYLDWNEALRSAWNPWRAPRWSQGSAGAALDNGVLRTWRTCINLSPLMTPSVVWWLKIPMPPCSSQWQHCSVPPAPRALSLPWTAAAHGALKDWPLLWTQQNSGCDFISLGKMYLTCFHI